MTAVSLGIVAVLLILTVIYVSGAFGLSSRVEERSVFIEGEYSVDGGEFKPTVADSPIREDFNSLTVKGRLSKPVNSYEMLVASVDNVWYKLSSHGELIATNYRDDSGALSDTPGYSISYIPTEQLYDSEDIRLEIIYPYTLLSSKNLNEFFDMYAGDEATVYELLFRHKTPAVLFCLLIMFFGLFTFPIAGIVLGRIEYRYPVFAVLCFFAGLFMLAQSIYSYVPLWVHDPVRALALCSIPTYLCMIAVFLYFKSNMSEKTNRVICDIVTVTSAAVSAAAVVLHYTGVSDMYATRPYMLIFAGICAVILTVCLFTEIRFDRAALMRMVSWIPIAAGLLLEGFNEFFCFTDLPLFEIGMTLTLLNQIAVLIIDLRAQYKEKIRYQQMQKELYEAKVSLMVSQIQPHFLYNSLTSIAMMCTKDPKTARAATINFADYLRGNMNSLRQRTPVPFAQELEHLKKYLMLEKMRFGDLLNIEYDIQTMDFAIPQLSVQPLVENAVKHGVGMKEDGGTVTIATRETDTDYEVVITDDGVGFDTSAPPKDDGRSHVGMENVRQRLRELCSAEVIIESEIGKGTAATIRIPKGENEE